MMHPHMSAYNEVFLHALCDNYSHIILKIFTGCHIMQLLLVNAMFERIFPPQEQNSFPSVLQFPLFIVLGYSLTISLHCSPSPVQGTLVLSPAPCVIPFPARFPAALLPTALPPSPMFFLRLLCSPALSD